MAGARAQPGRAEEARPFCGWRTRTWKKRGVACKENTAPSKNPSVVSVLVVVVVEPSAAVTVIVEEQVGIFVGGGRERWLVCLQYGLSPSTSGAFAADTNAIRNAIT